MRSFLIVGGTREERFKKAQRMVNSKWRIDSFDKIILEEENVKSIGIDQIRALRHQLSLKPYASSYKVAILPEAEKLTIPAQNAMLKLLEEPPRNTIIILSSPTTEVLLPTIVSRCQIIRLPNKTQIEIDKEIFNSQFSILNSILKSGVGERIKSANEIAKNRERAVEFCQAQLIIWREKMVNAKSAKEKAKNAKILRLIQKGLRLLEANVNPKLCLENLLLSMPSSDDPGSSQV